MLIDDMARDKQARRAKVHRQRVEQIGPSALERPTYCQNHEPRYFFVIITIRHQLGNMYSVIAAMSGKSSKEAESPRSGPRYACSTSPAAQCSTRFFQSDLRDKERKRGIARLGSRQVAATQVALLKPPLPPSLPSPTRWVACSQRALETRFILAAVVSRRHSRRADERAYACKDAAARRERTKTRCRRGKGNRGPKKQQPHCRSCTSLRSHRG